MGRTTLLSIANCMKLELTAEMRSGSSPDDTAGTNATCGSWYSDVMRTSG